MIAPFFFLFFFLKNHSQPLFLGLMSLLSQSGWQRAQLPGCCCAVLCGLGLGLPAEALVWTAGPSDPSSLLLNWF